MAKTCLDATAATGSSHYWAESATGQSQRQRQSQRRGRVAKTCPPRRTALVWSGVGWGH